MVTEIVPGEPGTQMPGLEVLGSIVSPAGRALLAHHGRPFRAAPALFHQEGDACPTVTVLSAGLLRVAKRRASGREITLYHVRPGELCVLEVLAVLSETAYAAEATIEEPVAGIAIPAAVFRAVVETEPGLRAALYRSFATRLALALDLVGDVALETLEARLAGRLLVHAQGGSEVHVTHERLAQELACAREAVSRILGSWEREGLVSLGRARIRLEDADAIAELAGPTRG